VLLQQIPGLQAEERLQQLRFDPAQTVDSGTMYDLVFLATGDRRRASQASAENDLVIAQRNQQ
jgi:hypothetical protein